MSGILPPSARYTGRGVMVTSVLAYMACHQKQLAQEEADRIQREEGETKRKQEEAHALAIKNAEEEIEALFNAAFNVGFTVGVFALGILAAHTG